jgi:uncharacterized coiled-coil protein SlyX
MNNDSDQEWQGHSPLIPLPVTRRRWPWLLVFLILALACAAGVYTWPDIVTLVPALDHEASSGGTAAGDQGLSGLLATQRKSEADLAALGRAVADQQEQLRTIVTQLVALTSKVEELQRAASAPASTPVVAAPAGAPIVQAAPRLRKPPSRAPEPSGGISTGGAPLSVAPGDLPH